MAINALLNLNLWHSEGVLTQAQPEAFQIDSDGPAAYIVLTYNKSMCANLEFIADPAQAVHIGDAGPANGVASDVSSLWAIRDAAGEFNVPVVGFNVYFAPAGP